MWQGLFGGVTALHKDAVTVLVQIMTPKTRTGVSEEIEKELKECLK